jgi:hypothetical protein
MREEGKTRTLKGEYGRCTLYTRMEIEFLNLLKPP